MKFHRSLAVAVLSASLTLPARAQFYDGNKLYSFCSSGTSGAANSHDWAMCTGFIAGLIDQEAMYAATSRGRPLFCVPVGATVQQARDVVVRHLAAHPQQRHWAAAAVASHALSAAFPCR